MIVSSSSEAALQRNLQVGQVNFDDLKLFQRQGEAK
jgi:hypothetical protein